MIHNPIFKGLMIALFFLGGIVWFWTVEDLPKGWDVALGFITWGGFILMCLYAAADRKKKA